MEIFKTYFNWSSGKDSALALYTMLNDPRYRVDQLVTTVNAHFNRVSMHGLRNELLLEQTRSLGLPLSLIELPEQPDMAEYQRKMLEVVGELKNQGYTHSAFGDIFLEDLRTYRETQLARENISAVFPIWKRDTTDLIHDFLALGFKAIVICADARYFNADFVGTVIDEDFLDKLPVGVDPCGENGEFHTFCYDGPIFKDPIEFNIGDTVYREYPSPKTDDSMAKSKTGFWYLDIIPKTGS